MCETYVNRRVWQMLVSIKHYVPEMYRLQIHVTGPKWDKESKRKRL